VPFYLSGFIRFEAAGVVNMLLLLENLILRFCKYQTTKSIRVRMLIYNAGPGPVISPESLSTGDVAAPKSHLFANLPICATRRFVHLWADRSGIICELAMQPSFH
jgi:hypothetical protein